MSNKDRIFIHSRPLGRSVFRPQEPRALARVGSIFIIGAVLCTVLFLAMQKRAVCQSALSPDISFSAESNVIYFLDKANSKLYRYTTQGRLTRTYTIDELGKDLK